MKIVHIITRLIRGGAEENTVLTCNWFAEAGHDVTLLHGDEWDADLVRQVDRRIERRCIKELCRDVSIGRDIRAAFIRSALRRIGPDVVHTHESKAGVVGRLAAAGYRVRGRAWNPHPAISQCGPLEAYVYLALESLVSPLRRVYQCERGAAAVGNSAWSWPGGTPLRCPQRNGHCAVHLGRSPIDRSQRAAGPLRAIYLANYEPRKRHLELLQKVDSRRKEFAGAVHFHFCGRGQLLADCEHFVREAHSATLLKSTGWCLTRKP